MLNNPESSVDSYIKKQVVFTKAGFLTGDELLFSLKVVTQGADPAVLALAYCALKVTEPLLIKVD